MDSELVMKVDVFGHQVSYFNLDWAIWLKQVL
jgi:hypothetical protein